MKGRSQPPTGGFALSFLCGDGDHVATIWFCLTVMQRECETPIAVSSLLYYGSCVILYICKTPGRAVVGFYLV